MQEKTVYTISHWRVMIEPGQSRNSLIFVEDFNHISREIFNWKDTKWAIEWILPSLYEEKRNNLSTFILRFLFHMPEKSFLNCLCLGVSDCIWIDLGEVGGKKLLEYWGTDGRVVFNSAVSWVAGAGVSLLYIACLQLQRRGFRPTERLELEEQCLVAMKQFVLDYFLGKKRLLLSSAASILHWILEITTN